MRSIRDNARRVLEEALFDLFRSAVKTSANAADATPPVLSGLIEFSHVIVRAAVNVLDSYVAANEKMVSYDPPSPLDTLLNLLCCVFTEFWCWLQVVGRCDAQCAL
jgi:hypothetical protein